MGFFGFLLMVQLIAIPNLLLNKVSEVAWLEQARLNELAGRTNRDVTFNLPLIPPFSWSLKNIDYYWFRYSFYNLSRMFHLTGIQLPSAFVNRVASYGINLSALGYQFRIICYVFCVFTWEIPYFYVWFLNSITEIF